MNWDKIFLAAIAGAVLGAARALVEESRKPQLQYKRHDQWRF